MNASTDRSAVNRCRLRSVASDIFANNRDLTTQNMSQHRGVSQLQRSRNRNCDTAVSVSNSGVVTADVPAVPPR